MNDRQFNELINQLKYLRAAQVNNTVKLVEVECVRSMGRQLTCEEKNIIIKDCLEEVTEIKNLLDSFGL